jgi:hypothetical protein
MKRSIQTAAILSLLATAAGAEECKVKITVAHWDGKALEIGFTSEQSRFWNREKAKRYPALCLDLTAPDYVIAWTERPSSDEIRKLAVRRGAGGSDPEKIISIPAGPSADSAHYFIFDLSKQLAVVVHTGAGAKELVSTAERPLGERPDAMPDKPLDLSRLPNSVPDPAEAMKNALDWLKKKH